MMDDRWLVARSLFGFLERGDVAYCVVGDTRSYPETISSDVDIVVPRGTLADVPGMLARFCREQGVRMVQMIQHEQTAFYFVLAWTNDSGELRFLAPDVCGDYYRGGRRLLAADEILEQRQPALDASGAGLGFYVPPPHVRFIYYLLKKIDKRNLNDGHGEYLSIQWHGDPGGAWGQICRFWPAPSDSELIAHAALNNEWSAVRAALPRLRRGLHRAAPLTLRGAIGELRRRVRRMVQPTGLVVAILGPDGCGKSSVIERMLADLLPAFRRIGYFHVRPRVFAGGKIVPFVVTNPHALPARGMPASLAKLAYFVFDYLSGWALRVRPLAIRSALVLFDRYYHDLLVDPKRYRYGGPMALARLAGKCVPAPDMWVLLDTPTEVLQTRKSEVSTDESERQRRAYFRLVNRRWNSVVIDGSQELVRVAHAVETAVLRFLEQRIERRHRGLRLKENPASARLLLFFCRWKVPVFSKVFRIIFNSDIYCPIRSPILMPHPYGITIHGGTVIGARVTIMQQATLGGKDLDKNEAPVIGDDVYIGAGARVLGAVQVGKGAIIGANAVVTRDVSPYCTVVGANRIVRGGARRTLVGPGRPAAGERASRQESLNTAK